MHRVHSASFVNDMDVLWYGRNTYLLNNRHRSILVRNCKSVYPNRMYHGQCSQANIVMRLDPSCRNQALSILFSRKLTEISFFISYSIYIYNTYLFCIYMYQPHSIHDLSTLGVDNQLCFFLNRNKIRKTQ